MKRTQWTVAAAGVALAFLAGQLTAQPPEPGKVPQNQLTARQQQFLADLSAAVKFNNDAKSNNLLAQAAGDSELAGAVIEKMWNYAGRQNAIERSKGETVAATFAAHQRQRHIELLEDVLAELKKKPNAQ